MSHQQPPHGQPLYGQPGQGPVPGWQGPVENPHKASRSFSFRRLAWPAIAALALFFGVGIGSSSGDASAPAADADPEVITETETVTEEVEVETTPQSCLDALDYGEQGFGVASDFAQAASDGFYAAADLDVVALEDAQGRIEQANADMDPISQRWNAAKEECREAGQ